MALLKPMLAVEADRSKIKYPCLVQPKLDGIRVTVQNGMLYTRSLKPVRNQMIQAYFKGLPDGLDGELIVGDPTAADAFSRTSSAVMAIKSDDWCNVEFYAFDMMGAGDHAERFISKIRSIESNHRVKTVITWLVGDEKELQDLYDDCVAKGYEGVMIRSIDAEYKHGRSTVNGGNLLKDKPFVDKEFVIVGMTELMHNHNEAVVNELGKLKRSSAKEGLVPSGMMGTIILQYGDDTFECGTGFTHMQRQLLWDNQYLYIGKLAKIKYQESGMKDKPRFPSFLGIRDKDDM